MDRLILLLTHAPDLPTASPILVSGRDICFWFSTICRGAWTTVSPFWRGFKTKLTDPLSRGKAVCTTDTIRRSWEVQIGKNSQNFSSEIQDPATPVKSLSWQFCRRLARRQQCGKMVINVSTGGGSQILKPLRHFLQFLKRCGIQPQLGEKTSFWIKLSLLPKKCAYTIFLLTCLHCLTGTRPHSLLGTWGENFEI